MPPPVLIRFPLDGPVERPYTQSRVTALWWGVLVLVVAFVAFQVVGAVATWIMLASQGVSIQQMVNDLQQGVFAQGAAILGANAIGQVVGLGVVAYGAARMHTSQPDAFLRLRLAPRVLPVLASVGIVLALVPVVQFVGEWNASLPLPESLRLLEESQLELIQSVLGSSQSIPINLVLLALTPALFEELLFRGYFQRQAERAVGHRWGIFLSGLLFGVFHLRFSQIVSLVLLGCVLAYVVWRTRSVWTGVIVHFFYNGSLVVLAGLADDPTEVLELHWSWFWIGGAAAVALMIWLRRLTPDPQAMEEEQAARTFTPVP
jgi:membrane protease YdiL (CAAX protease family)